VTVADDGAGCTGSGSTSACSECMRVRAGEVPPLLLRLVQVLGLRPLPFGREGGRGGGSGCVAGTAFASGVPGSPVRLSIFSLIVSIRAWGSPISSCVSRAADARFFVAPTDCSNTSRTSLSSPLSQDTSFFCFIIFLFFNSSLHATLIN